MMMVPESGVDENRMPESSRRHEVDAASRNAARHHSGRRRSHVGSNAHRGSCGKSALGLEAERENRDRPQYCE